MGMDGAQLGTNIANAIMDPNATNEARQAVIEFWRKIAGEIVSHIQDNAQVLPGISLATVVTGAIPAGTAPVTGSGSTTGAGKIR